MKKIIFLSLSVLLFASQALAEETDLCAAECPSGQKRIGFADGNKATCLCVDPGPGMVETLPVEATSPSADDGEPMPEDEE